MTSAPAQQPVVTVSGPGDLVSLAPYLLGFHPRRSLVVLSLRGPRLRCGLAARFDLPADTVPVEEFAAEVLGYVLRDAPRQVALLVYDDAAWSPSARPWQPLASALEREFDGAGAPVKEAVYVGADHFWSYTCRSARCCPDDGTPLALAAGTHVAAELVLQGRAPLADRDELVRAVAPSGPLTTAAVATAAIRELEYHLATPDHQVDDDAQAWAAEVTELFSGLVARFGADSGASLTGDEAGRLAAALTDVGIRDALTGEFSNWMRVLPTGATQEPADRPLRHDQDPVTAVLRHVAVMCDGWLAVGPLTLLAAQYWAAGEGALANAAVERALAIDPGYRLARLVGQLLRAGIPPAWVTGARPTGVDAGEPERRRE